MRGEEFLFSLILLALIAGALFVVLRLRRGVEAVAPLYAPADVTRLALGSLLLQGPLLRGLIIRRTANPFRARSPEPGLDIELVAAAARRFDDEDQGYWWTIAGLALAPFLLNRPSILVLVWLAAIVGVSLRRRWRIRFRLAPRFAEAAYDPAALRRELGLGEAARPEGVEVVCHGGGDSFASGLTYGFLADKGPQCAAECGAAHGALAMTTPGDTTMATQSEVERVMKGEAFLRQSGFRNMRVRIHEDIARIEVAREQIEKLLDLSDEITRYFKSLGFLYITMDLQGYRQGSLNEGLKA